MPYNVRLSRLATMLALFVGCSFCTDAQLLCNSNACLPKPQNPPDNVVSTQGQFCTADPGLTLYPYKVLFIIDVSGSTKDSDAMNNRSRAVQQAVNQYISNPAVSFAIIDFDTAARMTVPTFTRDINVLNAAIPLLNQHLMNTNYSAALALAQQMIDTDAQGTAPGLRARTRYDIQFLSDGQPDPCETPAQVLANEQKVLDLRDKYGLYDVRLSTINLLNVASKPPGCEAYSPKDYMTQMAHAGGGLFSEADSSSLAFKIAFTQIYRVFQKHGFFLVNHSRTIKNNTINADSDQDGVSDPEEMAMGTNPKSADPTKSGCSDRVNQSLLPNKSLCVDSCSRPSASAGSSPKADTDLDSLLDCAELSLGTARTNPDSDSDGLTDEIELRFGTNPLDPKTISVDTDLDGALDRDEIYVGTDPITPQTDKTYAYDYSALDEVKTQSQLQGNAVSVQGMDTTTPPAAGQGITCYNFKIDNVRLVETTDSDISAAGDNNLCLYVVQSAVDDPTGQPTVTRACQKVNYKVANGLGIKVPATGVLDFTPADFKPYICPNGVCAK